MSDYICRFSREKIKEIYESGKKYILCKVGADYCPPCRALESGNPSPLHQLMDKINQEVKDKIYMISIDNNDNAEDFFYSVNIKEVTKIPAFFLIAFHFDKNSECIYTSYGFSGYNIVDWVNAFSNNIKETIKNYENNTPNTCNIQ
ncbi:hypothetical protein AB836_01100 [Rickettsiales bacterium (ex Bugula neritina AB1)]|nr:hypothetical protein AB836_01100 [Rickettsiales bacterium (ex Bugula neritina AB1)]